jgi:hypothetical protein
MLSIRPAGSAVVPRIEYTGNNCGQTTNGPVSSCSLTNVAAGDLIVIHQEGGVGVTDSQGEIISAAGSTGVGTQDLSTWIIPSVAHAGSHTFTATAGYIRVMEFRGQASSPVDVTNYASQSNSGPVQVSATTSNVNDLILVNCATTASSDNEFTAQTAQFAGPTSSWTYLYTPGTITVACNPYNGPPSSWTIQVVALSPNP